MEEEGHDHDGSGDRMPVEEGDRDDGSSDLTEEGAVAKFSEVDILTLLPSFLALRIEPNFGNEMRPEEKVRIVDALSMSMHTLEEVTKGPEKLMWPRKDGRSMEDRVLFLGWPDSFAVDASRLGVTGGFAYFLYYDDQGGRLPHERHGMFRYNTTEFVEWLPQGWDSDMCMWLLPQLTIAPIQHGPANTSRSNNTCAGVLMPNLPLSANSSWLQHLFSMRQHLFSMFSRLFGGKKKKPEKSLKGNHVEEDGESEELTGARRVYNGWA
uniref:Uncharacterized protein n=1 Tax=Aegilops tauschii TaxID=37682 RepID=M8AZB6_AEGTA